MQNGTISLKVTPYVGTYDGQEHNALSNICVEPSDAKLEYSLDGENYVTEMPKIKDTSEFTVTVVASKEGYKTVSTTETIKVNGASYNTTMPIITNASSFTVIVRASKVGYKTESSTQTTKVNKASGSLSLSSYSGTINYPNSTSFTTSGTGSISAWSSNTGVATVSVSGNTVTVKSVGAGSATITVKSASNTNYNERTGTYSVTVKDNTFTGTSGVGYYADVDGNGTVDGIIFEDFKKGGSGSWGGTNYTISTVTGLKEYYVSKTNYNGPFGTKNVLSARGSGNARFNVMALSDYNNSATYTFTNAKSITSGEWRVPTSIELAAFGGELGITTLNYSGYGLKATYWSSTAIYFNDIIRYGCCVSFSNGKINGNGIGIKYPVRLARTF